MNRKNITTIIFISFGLSGMAALIYEVVWARQLTLIFGTTLYGISTVLAVFMAGLALGSLIFGRIADRSKNPLRLYAFLEGGIGIYVLFTPLIFKLINNLQIYLAQNFAIDFSGFSLIRFGLCFSALLIPTTLMGGTLPVIVKFFVRSKEKLGGYVGKLYSLNTLGGVLGAFLTGFALILLLGVQETIYLAAFINLLIFGVILFLSRKIILQPIESPLPVQAPSKISNIIWLVLVAFGFSGFAALSLEASWARVLNMVLGSSVYAFSIVLTTFLAGIALGSFIMSKFVDRIKNLLLWFVLIEISLGLSVILFTPLFGYLPNLFMKVFQVTNGSFWSLQFMEFLLAGLVMILPTILMGAAFPLVAKICTPELKKVGRHIGNVYFVNTFGAVFGSLATGFIFIPLFGLQTSIFIAAFIYLAIVVPILLLTPFAKPLVKISLLSFLVVICASTFFIPSWNKNVLNSGVYIYARAYLQLDPNLQALSNEQLFYKEGLSATVAVEKIKEGDLILRINGKTDASTNLDMDTQLILGHLPLLLHKNPERVLIIGLGSGITLGAVEQHEEIKEIDVVEIEPAVVEAASYFSEYNNNALKDPRLNLIIEDGRNYVLTTNKKYDVITAEPSNPWMSGNANLFTKEQFELYKKRLKPEGIMFQWAHIYKLNTQDVKTIMATFQEVFPHTVLWQNYFGRDIFMVGSEAPLKIDFAVLQEKMARKNVKKDLARTYLDDPFMLLSYSILNEEGVRIFSEGAKIHTDKHPILEFRAPKGMFLHPALTVSANLESLEKHRTNIFTLLEEIDDSTLQEKIALYALFRIHIMQGEITFSRDDPTEKGIAEYEKALFMIPDNIRAKKRLAETLFFLGEAYLRQGNSEEAIWAYEKTLELEPSDLHSRQKLGVLYGRKGEIDRAEQQFLLILSQDDRNYFAHNNLANVYKLKGRREQAIVQYQKSLEINPEQEEIRELLRELKK